MARTYKHIQQFKNKHYYSNMWDTEHEKFYYEGYVYTWPDYNETKETRIMTRWLKKPGVKSKKRKEVDTEYHWMSTPSWWTRLCMIKPQRREGSLWEREVVKISPTDLEEVDKPSVSRKPHIYYW